MQNTFYGKIKRVGDEGKGKEGKGKQERRE